MSGTDRLPVLESAALDLLARREHSRHELRGKLLRRFGDMEAAVAQVLDDLEHRGLLSDMRFTEQYVGSRVGKGYGPLRIRLELQERGIGAELIDIFLDAGDTDWSERLRRLAAQRFGAGIPGAQRERAKIARFLHYRGYPESMIRHYLFD